MKKFRFQRLLLIVLLVSTFVGTLCGCKHRIAGNYPFYSYIDFIETENGFLVPNYEINIYEKTYQNSSTEFPLSENYLDGGTAHFYTICPPLGFEGVTPHIEALEKATDSAVVDTRGYLSDGKLYGFVNLFKDTVGYLFAAGNYGMEEISAGMVFAYTAENNEFREMKQFVDCNIVAFHHRQQTVLYWKNKNYYAYDLRTQTETFLVEDKAFDSGFQHQSYTFIYTNSAYTLFLMTKAKIRDTTYAYLYNYATKEFLPLLSKEI